MLEGKIGSIERGNAIFRAYRDIQRTRSGSEGRNELAISYPANAFDE